MVSTVNTDGAWTFQSMDTALIGRLHDQAFLASGNAGSLSGAARGGVLASSYTTGFAGTPNDLYVSAQTSPNMSVLVFPGAAVIPRAGQAAYTAMNTQQRTLTITTANATNPRIDLIYYQILDQVFGDAGAPTVGGYAQVGVVTGVASGSPVVPSTPVNAIPLAQVLVGANVLSIVQGNITDVRRGAALNGAARPMLAGDALSDPGYKFGELRYVYNSSLSQNLYSNWGQDGNWHGLQDVQGPACTYPLPGGSTMPAAATYILGQVVIPDPGYAYHLECSASAATSGDSHGSNIEPCRIRLDNATTGTTVAITAWLINNAVGYALMPTVSTQPSAGALTGSHTVYWVSQYTHAFAATYQGNNGTSWLNCTIVPA